MRKKKDEDVIIITDDHSKLEKKFEETGRKIGEKTGKIVTKSLDGIEKTKLKLKDNETLEKVKVSSKSTLEKAKYKVKHMTKKKDH